jgi:hypothetical protein
VTLLLDPPAPVELDHVEELMRWVVEVDWWTSEPVSREYRLAILRGRLLCEIYRDRGGESWFVERVYD